MIDEVIDGDIKKPTKKAARKVADKITLRDRPDDIIIDLEDGSRGIISKDRLQKCWLKTEEEKENVKKIVIEYNTKKELIKKLLIIQPLYYDEGKLWWAWKKEDYKWGIVDEIDILNFVKELSYYDTINSKERTEMLEALKQEGRKNIPKPIKLTWIQFKDEIIDFQTGKHFKATPDYFVTNPIPWELHNNKFEETPIIDRIFEEWVGKEHVKTLYQIIAYCLVPDYPIHRLFCLIGAGLNGKSCFLRLLKKFVGRENITSTELDILLSSRFEITRLHKKLVCVMGETNFAEMSKTSIIKKLTGQDTIGFEYKNKNPFEDNNYAKILIATNNLPTTTDKTIGFYRRWCIIDFPNTFSEEKDILDEIPDEEYQSLALKSLSILKDLLKDRKFHKEGTVEERAKKYEEKSNPLDKFWKDNIIEDFEYHIFKYDFKEKLKSWCKENRFREISDITVAQFMKDKNIETKQIQASWETKEGVKPILRAWICIKWRD